MWPQFDKDLDCIHGSDQKVQLMSVFRSDRKRDSGSKWRSCKRVTEEEKSTWANLLNTVKKNVLTCQADRHRRREVKRARKQVTFIVHHINLSSLRTHGQLGCFKEEINQNLYNTYSDGEREQHFGPCKALISPPEPNIEFNTRSSGLQPQAQYQALMEHIKKSTRAMWGSYNDCGESSGWSGGDWRQPSADDLQKHVCISEVNKCTT